MIEMPVLYAWIEMLVIATLVTFGVVIAAVAALVALAFIEWVVRRLDKTLAVCLVIMVLMLVAGCVAGNECVPVTPTGVVYKPNGDCLVIIGGKAFNTIDRGICTKIVLNETNWVKFEPMSSDFPVRTVCTQDV